jgi:hypothetical protein
MTRWLVWTLAWMAVCAAGCDSDSQDGAAGSGGDSGVTSSSSTASVGGETSNSSSASGAGAGGAGGSGACVPLCADLHPLGAELYDALARCVYCDACPIACNRVRYLVCERPSAGGPCEGGKDCDSCTRCAKNLACADAFVACSDDRDCIEYAICIAPCG